MILPFKEEIVNDCEYSTYNFEHPRFIGYLNKYGEVLDFSEPLGIGGHNINKLTAYFEEYFRMPTNDIWRQQFEDRDPLDKETEQWYAQNRRKLFQKRLEYNSYLIKEYGVSKDPEVRFQADLELFFYNCYQADTFMDGFGQNCMALNKPEFYKKYCKSKRLFQRESNESEKQYLERHKRFLDYDYHWYKKKLMLDWYKVVIVQYMHFHLVERCKKGITTCDRKPHETFYNYIKEGFTIHQIPSYVYDSKKKMYILQQQNSFLVPDSESRLKDEIQAIRKLVPLGKRREYDR